MNVYTDINVIQDLMKKVIIESCSDFVSKSFIVSKFVIPAIDVLDRAFYGGCYDVHYEEYDEGFVLLTLVWENKNDEGCFHCPFGSHDIDNHADECIFKEKCSFKDYFNKEVKSNE